MERADERLEMVNREFIAKAVGASFDWDKRCVVPPADLEESRIGWAIRALEERLEAIRRSRLMTGTDLEQSPRAAASASEAARAAMERKKKKGKE